MGAVLSAALLCDGHDVRVLDSLMFGGDGVVGLLEDPRFSLQVDDIRSASAVRRAVEGIDVVIHLAALVGEPACGKRPDVAREINLDATVQLVDLARAHGVSRFIFASTCSNYGVSDPSLEAEENAPLHPLSLYAETKIAAEQAVLAAHHATFHPCVLRLATVFGLSPRMRFNLMVSQFVRDAVCGREVMLYRPEAWRPLTHVRDAVDAYRRCIAASTDTVSGQVFNAGTANYRKRDLIDILMRIVPETKVELREGASDPRDYRVSFAKIRRVLGFSPSHTLEGAMIALKIALEQGVFGDPYAAVYEAWYDEAQLVPWVDS